MEQKWFSFAIGQPHEDRKDLPILFFSERNAIGRMYIEWMTLEGREKKFVHQSAERLDALMESGS